MSDIKKYLENSESTAFWSLQIGKFINAETGVDLRESLGVSSFLFQGSLKEWCELLYEHGVSTLLKITGEQNNFERKDKKDSFYASSAVYRNLKMVTDYADNLSIYKNDDLPYDTLLVVSEEGKSGVVKVLNMNENGSIVI